MFFRVWWVGDNGVNLAVKVVQHLAEVAVPDFDALYGSLTAIPFSLDAR